MKHVVIYVPGLGDKMKWLVWLQKWALSLWRIRGVKPIVITMRWTDPVLLQPRFNKLLDCIDRLHGEGKTVSLIGTSAGASTVVSAFTQKHEKVAGVVTVCGKLQGGIPDSVKQLNPSFAESLNQLGHSMKRLTPDLKKRILNIYSPLDAVVPPNQAVIVGAQKIETHGLGHNLACAHVLLFGSKEVVRFLNDVQNLTE